MQVFAMENIRSRRQVIERIAFLLGTDAILDLSSFRLDCIGIVTARLLYQGEAKLRHKDVIVAGKEAQSLF